MSVPSQHLNLDFDLEGPTTVRMANDGFLPKSFTIDQLAAADAVKPSYVSLQHRLVWHAPQDSDAFIHEEKVGEDWNFKFNMDLRFAVAGEWDARHPVAHAVFGGMDITSAGFDDAYMRALQALNIMLARERENIGDATRRIITQYVRTTYQPFRFLMRAASLWAVLARRELFAPGATEWRQTGRRAAPLHLWNLHALEQLATTQTRGPHDVLFAKLNHPDEFYMVDVMAALASTTFPIEGEESTLSLLWPSLNMPEVVYTCDVRQAESNLPITSNDVWGTIVRFCDVFDCHDLWKEALHTCQAFVARPKGSAVLAGVNNLVWHLPASDLRIGAIGPVLAGVSVEAMKSEPFEQPEAKCYLYGGAIRGCFVTASYYESLCMSSVTHPVAASLGLLKPAHVRSVCTFRYASAFWRDKVAVVAKSAGWECVTNGLRGLTPTMSNTVHLNLMTASRVPWWVNVLPFMPAGGDEFLSNWLRPAKMLSMPSVNAWQPFYTVTGTSHQQVAAALRWTNAELRYNVYMPNGTSAQVAIGQVNPNRFMPPVVPKMRLGAYGAIAALKFDRNIYKRYELIRKLGRCSIEVLHDYDEEMWLGDPLEGIDNTFPDAATLGLGGVFAPSVTESMPRAGLEFKDWALTGDIDKEALAAYQRLVDNVGGVDADEEIFTVRGEPGVHFPPRGANDIKNLMRLNGEFIRRINAPMADKRQWAQDAVIVLEHLSTIVRQQYDASALRDSVSSLQNFCHEADRELNKRERSAPVGVEERRATEDASLEVDDVLKQVAPSDEEVTRATDDPVAPSMTAEAFFQSESGLNSVSTPSVAGSVESASEQGPGLGFAPAETSSQ
nr:hypothetical protein [Umbelopsis ramanniana virus 5]